MKLNSGTSMAMKSSVVIFQALEPLQPQKPYFIKELSDSYSWIIPGTKMTNTCPFLWNASSKIEFFTDFSTFSSRGC